MYLVIRQFSRDTNHYQTLLFDVNFFYFMNIVIGRELYTTVVACKKNYLHWALQTSERNFYLIESIKYTRMVWLNEVKIDTYYTFESRIKG